MSVPIRTIFGFSFAALDSSWCGEDVVESEKKRQFEAHVLRVRQSRGMATTVTATLVERSGPDIDGLEFEWVTE